MISAFGKLYSLIKQEKWFIFSVLMVCLLEYVSWKMWYSFDPNVFIDVDEVEHLRSSYNILAGRIPFRDFFEHHNLLLSYLFVPVAYFYPRDPTVLLAARFFVYLVLGINVFISYQILLFFKSAKNPINQLIYAVLLPAVFFVFALYNGHIFHFRPDTLMSVFLVLSIFSFFQFIKNNKLAYLSLSFVFLLLSFLSLQKSLIYLPIIPAFCLYLIYKKKLSFQKMILASVPSLLIVLFYVSYLFLTDSLLSYYHCNILVNIEISKLLSHGILYPNIFKYALYLGLICCPIFLIKNNTIYGWVIVSFYAVSFASVVYINPFNQYFIPIVCFIPFIFMGIIKFSDAKPKHNIKILPAVVLFICVGGFLTFNYNHSIDSIETHINQTNKVMNYAGVNGTVVEFPFLHYNLFNSTTDYYEFTNGIFGVVREYNISLPLFDPIENWRRTKPDIIITRFGFHLPEDFFNDYEQIPSTIEIYRKKQKNN